MAGGKLPPRQKMIGMMYLVLTAMLALNVSKDILNAFIIVNDGLEKTSVNFKDKIEDQHTEFAKAYNENKKKAEKWYKMAQEVEKRSNELYHYITMIKANIIYKTEGYPSIEDAYGKDANDNDTLVSIKNIGKKDNYDILTNEMIGSEPGAPKEGEYTAHELKTKMDGFRAYLTGLEGVKDGTLEETLNATFDFSDRKDASGTVNNWESYNFYHTPLAATLTILSKMQNDVRNAESDVLKVLFTNVDKGSFKFNKLEPAVIAPTNYIMEGDSFRADVFLAAYDSTKAPQIFIGSKLDSLGNNKYEITSEDKMELKVVDGMGKIAIRRPVGAHTWSGIINYQAPGGVTLQFPFKTSFTVAVPSLVVSPDKMNVFYRGVTNPVSISVAGVPSDKITPSITNGSISKNGSHWDVKVGRGNEAVVSVTAEMADGSKTNMGNIKFRVKRIPDPVPYVAGETGASTITKAKIGGVSTVQARMDNFDFDIKVDVQSYIFSMALGDVLVEEKINGKRLTPQVKDLIKKARRGNKIYFEKIKCKMPDGTIRELPPVSLKITG